MKSIVAAMTAACFMAASQVAWSSPTADEIMQKNFFASKPSRLQKEVTMTLLNDRGEKRERKIAALTSLQANGIDSNMLVRFLAPADVKGSAFLEIEHSEADDDQWIYLPALHKSRRLVSSNRKDSFIGSDFAYGDVLPPKVSLYQNKLLREEAAEGVPCYVIESVPSNDDVRRDYGYGRKLSWIAKDSFHEVRVEYFDVTDRPLKTEIVRGITLVEPANHRYAPTYKEMTNLQTGHKTIVTADHYTTEASIGPETYTLRSLEKD